MACGVGFLDEVGCGPKVGFLSRRIDQRINFTAFHDRAGVDVLTCLARDGQGFPRSALIDPPPRNHPLAIERRQG